MNNKKLLLYQDSGFSYQDNLVAYYKFDSNSNDFSGNIHNGVDFGTNYTNTGKVGNSVTLTSGTDRIEISQSEDFDFSNAISDIPFSISLWINLVNSSATQWVMSKRGPSVAQWQIAISSNLISIAIFTNTSNFISARNDVNISNNTWNNFIFTYNGNGTPSGCEIYENGLDPGTPRTLTGTYTKMPIASQPMVIGNENFTTSYVLPLNGKLDETYIWKNRVITPDEALDIYNKGVTGLTLI